VDLQAYLGQCLAAWNDSRRDAVVTALHQGLERVPVGRAYLRFRRTLRGYRASYIKPLTSHLRRALRELGTNYLDEITPDKVAAWAKSNVRKLPAWTAKNLRRALNAFTSWAVREHLLTDDPVKDVKAPKNISDPDALDPEQVPAVLDAAKGHQGEVAVSLALLTGLRRREISALQGSHVDLANKRLALPSTVVKANTKPRRIPIPDRLVKLLSSRELDAPDLPPAGGHHPDTYSDWAAEILETAGIRKAGPRRALQVLRRTWVSVLRHEGAPADTVARMAGHSLDVANRHYLKVYKSDDMNLIERVLSR
jgi:integrase